MLLDGIYGRQISVCFVKKHAIGDNQSGMHPPQTGVSSFLLSHFAMKEMKVLVQGTTKGTKSI